MLENIASQLHESDKGQLQYGVPKEKHSLFIKVRRSSLTGQRTLGSMRLKVCLYRTDRGLAAFAKEWSK